MVAEGKKQAESLSDESPAGVQTFLRPWMQRFLGELEKLGNLTDACRVANVSQRTAYAWKADDLDFSTAWGHAVETAIDNVERKGMTIAAEGYQRPIIRDGVLIGHESIHDPRLIEFFLKTRRRAVYGDKVDVTVSGSLGVAVMAGADLERLIASVHPSALPVVPPLALPAEVVPEGPAGGQA